MNQQVLDKITSQEKLQNGPLKLPILFVQEQLINHMMTPDERSDPKNAEIASRVLYWFESDKGEVRVHEQETFIKIDTEGFQGKMEAQRISLNGK